MSKLFFDHLLDLKELDREVKKVVKTPEEREEFWGMIDEIIHHRVMGCILDNLPKENHREFLEMFHKSPHNEPLLMGYLKKQIGENFEELLRQELGTISSDLLNELH